MRRDYPSFTRALGPGLDRNASMQAFVDAAWPVLSPAGVSWIGFYLHTGADELVLGPRRDKPACSPIGLHGACGQSLREGRVWIVRDVRTLGEHYIACDPRDMSELVIPLFDAAGAAWGVLDLDSFEVSAFDETDAAELEGALTAAGLTHPAMRPEPRVL
jgi:putative methionine-R-sulfoxide reductase with GAF domain